jgi:3-methylcrotonyl-CoA carboxylase alpha subunit
MFSSVLIANRGEIAVRIARTAKRLGLRTIAVYSEADAGALHVRACDEAVAIGPAAPRESYLNIDKLIEVARRTAAQCIHPGYGFLSENADFAEAALRANIAFIGPSPAAIRAMGLKDRAKALMEKAGVPVVPGYHGDQQAPAFLKRKAYEIGYPVLVKAVAGGGGRGMRRVDKHADFDDALAAAQREAESAFGDARVLIEKYIEAPRHIEFQVFGDGDGQVIHLNERDCSLQRRHQKVIEEAPAPGMTAELRADMGRAAVEAARAIGYVGAGTVEFIAAAASGLKSGGFWFMEMNTRLQVEHPVTEAVTGFDLVEWQFRIASGETIGLRQEDVPLVGHAVEARIYAEDPDRGFLPSPGRIVALELPQGEGIRVDAGVEAGLMVPPDYDPMIAKVIAHGATRTEALDRLGAALGDTIVIGPRVNTPFLSALVAHPDFRAGRFDTGFIDAQLKALLATDPAEATQAAADGVAFLLERERMRFGSAGAADEAPSWRTPWGADDGFSLGPLRALAFDVIVDGVERQAHIAWGAGGAQVSVDGIPARGADRVIEMPDGVVVAGGRPHLVAFKRPDTSGGAPSGEDTVRAPMNGKVIAVLVEVGQKVKLGARVAVMEAMKMEHSLTAPRDGIVAEVAAAGAQVTEGAAVVRLEAPHPTGRSLSSGRPKAGPVGSATLPGVGEG